jgi:hypothetical protein
MTDQQKIELADTIIDAILEKQKQAEIPTMIGSLKKPFGINGFQTAQQGHPVFETKDRYTIYLQSNCGKHSVIVPFYKDTLEEYVRLCVT